MGEKKLEKNRAVSNWQELLIRRFIIELKSGESGQIRVKTQLGGEVRLTSLLKIISL